MPPVPVSPALTSTRELRISVIKVIPETGLVPTMAIALAATVVNRNAMTKTIRIAMLAWNQLFSTPNWKNIKVVSSVAISTVRISFIGRVALRTLGRLVGSFFPFEFADGQPQRLPNNLRRTDNTYDARHGDAADTDMARIVTEDLFRAHIPRKVITPSPTAMVCRRQNG